jgi:phosphatidylinositol-3-phosphatase
MPRPPGPLVAATILCLMTLLGCTTDAATTSAPKAEARGGQVTTEQPADPTQSVRKVLVFVVENHSSNQMRSQMPYTSALADRYGYTTSYRALTHPSLGNYLAIAGGSTFGVADDRSPEAHQLHGPSVFSQAQSAGRTAAVYAEGMPTNCALEDGGDRYAVRHNPWTYFVDERAACDVADVPVDELPASIADGGLPNVGMVIPDLCNDAHDCSLDAADDWLRTEVERVLTGPDWRSGRLAVVITADEDDRHDDNLVLTAVLHPTLRHVVVDQPLTHLSLSRFLSEVTGQPPLRDAAGTTSLGDAFGLRVSS